MPDDDIPQEKEELKPDPFVALFAGLMILLCTFFIVLCSMSTQSTGKLEAAQSSLNNAFINLGVHESSELMWFVNSFTFFSKKTKAKTAKEHLKQDIDKGIRGQQGFFEKDQDEKFRRISEIVMENSVIIKRDQNTLFLIVPADNFFRKRDFKISKQGKKLLNKVEELILGEEKRKLLVSSYTKEKLLYHSDYFSFMLASKRANEICNYLHQQGVSYDDLAIRSFGNLCYRKEERLFDKVELAIS